MCRGGGSGGGWGLISGVEEVVVVGITTQGTAQCNWKFRHMHVEEPLIRAIQGGAGPEGGRHEGEPSAMEFQGGSVGEVQPLDFVGGVGEGFRNDKGSAAIEAQLANPFNAGIALYLDFGRDNVTHFVGDQIAGGVGSVCGVESSFLSEVTEDLSGEHGLSLAQAEELIQVVGSVVVVEDGGKFREVAVDGESEGASNGRHAADDVSAVNGRGIPSVDSDVGSFRGDLGVP